MRGRIITKAPVGLLLAAGAASAAGVVATYSEDFRSFLSGPVDGQQGWFSPAGDEAVVTDGADQVVRYERASRYAGAEWGVVGPEFSGGYGLLELEVTVWPGSEDEPGASPQVAT